MNRRGGRLGLRRTTQSLQLGEGPWARMLGRLWFGIVSHLSIANDSTTSPRHESSGLVVWRCCVELYRDPKIRSDPYQSLFASRAVQRLEVGVERHNARSTD
jgi:hypothetical protein